jgi:uracil-DNA glycosylase family 4
MQMVNWEKDDTEYMGLMKLDILSLKMLSILGMTRDLIQDNYDKKIIFEDIPLDDSKVISDINQGNVIGLFQVTGYATKSLIDQMPIEVFNDIVAVIALSRPGPLGSGMTNDYILRKNGGKWNAKHAIYETITQNTYGLLVYQEQVMAVIHKVAGLPYSTADKIRKIIGKKRDPKEFAKYKKQFVNGCRSEKTLLRKEAKTFWQGLQSWAKYGFNLAHSVEYATIAYWCAWIKHYYPTEFICSSLTFGAKDKKKELVEEAYRVGLELIPPMVKGETQATKWVAKEDKLYIPFREVEGLGEVKAHEAKQTRMTASLLGVTKPHDDALAKTLLNIDAYREKEKTIPTRTLKKYFSFRISTSPKQQYKKLYELSGNTLRARHLELALAGDYKYLKKHFDWEKLIQEPSFDLRKRFMKKLWKCTACDLKINSPVTIAPKLGEFNIAVIEESKGSKVIWNAMKKRKYYPKHFYVTTINKCMPRHNDVSAIEIDACSLWLNKELKKVKPVISIAFGNNALYYFTGKLSGITALNGTTQWLEEYGMWVCWCIHPSSTHRNPENKKHFKRGMSNFFRTLNATGFKNML